MTPEEIQAMAKGLAEGQAVWYLGSAVIGGAITGLAAYLAEKGKNRATREDIAAITREVENVRDVFNRQMEDLKAHHQLRMVAAERRMQAHQEAYKLWLGFHITVRHDYETMQHKISDAHAWFSSNCIFLTPTARAAFVEMTQTILVYADIQASGAPENEKKKLLNSYTTLGNIFLTEIDLPTLSRSDIRSLEGGTPRLGFDRRGGRMKTAGDEA